METFLVPFVVSAFFNFLALCFYLVSSAKGGGRGQGSPNKSSSNTVGAVLSKSFSSKVRAEPKKKKRRRKKDEADDKFSWEIEYRELEFEKNSKICKFIMIQYWRYESGGEWWAREMEIV
jgi:hypothetical protein